MYFIYKYVYMYYKTQKNNLFQTLILINEFSKKNVRLLRVKGQLPKIVPDDNINVEENKSRKQTSREQKFRMHVLQHEK